METRGRRTTIAGSAALTAAILPVFLLGAGSDAIQSELGFGATATGTAATLLLLSAGLAARAMGRLTERLGAGTALRIGVTVAGLATAAIGLFADAWWQIALPMAVTGVAVGLVDTGAALAFADGVPRERQGAAFGIKEASVPAASLLAGIGLPTIAATYGWRSLFVAALGVTAVFWLLLPPGRSPRRAAPRDAAAGSEASRSAGLVRFTVGIGLGTGAATAAATFLVPTGIDRGLSTVAAGALLSVASVASILARITMGWWADRASAVPARAVTVMHGIGGAGAALLAIPAPDAVAVAGAVATLGAGWGWTGLAFVTAVRARPDAPANAAGVVLTGLGLGGALGPVAFGAIADGASYPVAWGVMALALAAGALGTGSSVRALAPHRTTTPSGDDRR